jgi:hypothetical protein
MELFKWKSTSSGRSTRNIYTMAKQLNVRGVKAFLSPMAPSSCWSRMRCSMMLTRFGLYGDRYMRRLHQDLLVSERALMAVVAFRAPFDCPTGSITSTTSCSSMHQCDGRRCVSADYSQRSDPKRRRRTCRQTRRASRGSPRREFFWWWPIALGLDRSTWLFDIFYVERQHKRRRIHDLEEQPGRAQGARPLQRHGGVRCRSPHLRRSVDDIIELNHCGRIGCAIACYQRDDEMLVLQVEIMNKIGSVRYEHTAVREFWPARDVLAMRVWRIVADRTYDVYP